MRSALLAITSIMILALGESGSAMADGKGSSAPPSAATGEVKAGPEPRVKAPVAGRAKEPAKASPDLERANGPERESPLLRLLWLLTGSSRRR